MAIAVTSQPRFRCGQVVMTRGVHQLVAQGKLDPVHYFKRHLNGDWGDLSEDDKRANEQALRNGTRLLSSYQVAPSLELWIITESDRSSSTLLLPDEY